MGHDHGALTRVGPLRADAPVALRTSLLGGAVVSVRLGSGTNFLAPSIRTSHSVVLEIAMANGCHAVTVIARGYVCPTAARASCSVVPDCSVTSDPLDQRL